MIEPKSRRPPNGPDLRRVARLPRQKQRTDGAGLVSRRPDGKAFDGPTVDARAKTAWRRGGLNPITLHEARHTFASLMIAAGANAKALATYMGTPP